MIEGYIYRLFTFCFLFFTLSLHTSLMAGSEVSIPFESDAGFILIEASVDGNIGTFIFDTAADQLLLDNVKSRTGATSLFTTINGDMQAAEVKLKTFRLGDFKRNNIKAYVTDLSDIEQMLGRNILGIIGAKLFQSELIYIDRLNNTLSFVDRSFVDAHISDASVSSDFNEEYSIFSMVLIIEGKAHTFILDSAASVSLVSNELIKRHVSLFTPLKKYCKLLGAHLPHTEAQYYSFLQLEQLDFLDKSMEMVGVDLSKVSESLGFKIDGILSITDLSYSSMIFDYESQKLYLF